MNKTRDEALQFIYAVQGNLPIIEEVDSVVCAPFLFLRSLVKRQGENLRIGAQNMHFSDSGAFTGEISAPMLKSIDVTYVIIGHSERRAMYNETDQTVNKKLLTAFNYDLKPILCVGENLEHREGGLTEKVIGKQLELNLQSLTPANIEELVIAYEPIWAIGTGRSATPEMAEETCAFIRKKVAELYNDEVAEKMRIQYGGSVKLSNIDDLMAQPNIDGALIGGASLDAEDFIALTKAGIKK